MRIWIYEIFICVVDWAFIDDYMCPNRYYDAKKDFGGWISFIIVSVIM